MELSVEQNNCALVLLQMEEKEEILISNAVLPDGVEFFSADEWNGARKRAFRCEMNEVVTDDIIGYLQTTGPDGKKYSYSFLITDQESINDAVRALADHMAKLIQ